MIYDFYYFVKRKLGLVKSVVGPTVRFRPVWFMTALLRSLAGLGATLAWPGLILYTLFITVLGAPIDGGAFIGTVMFMLGSVGVALVVLGRSNAIVGVMIGGVTGIFFAFDLYAPYLPGVRGNTIVMSVMGVFFCILSLVRMIDRDIDYRLSPYTLLTPALIAALLTLLGLFGFFGYPVVKLNIAISTTLAWMLIPYLIGRPAKVIREESDGTVIVDPYLRNHKRCYRYKAIIQDSDDSQCYVWVTPGGLYHPSAITRIGERVRNYEVTSNL